MRPTECPLTARGSAPTGNPPFDPQHTTVIEWMPGQFGQLSTITELF
jgi:hypothetical protein